MAVTRKIMYAENVAMKYEEKYVEYIHEKHIIIGARDKVQWSSMYVISIISDLFREVLENVF